MSETPKPRWLESAPVCRRRAGLIRLIGLLLGGYLLLPAGAGATTFTVTNAGDSAPGACDADCTLREAMIVANATIGEDVIAVPPGSYSLSLAGAPEDAAASGDLDLTEGVEIRGTGATPGAVVIDASGLGDRILHVPAGTFGDFELVNLTLRDGSAADRGGALRNESDFGQVRVRSVVFDSNDAAGGGGAIHNEGTGDQGKLLVDESVFTANSATTSTGGAIRTSGDSRVLVTDSSFSGNFAVDRDGGALSNNDSASFVVLDSTFTGNMALGTPFNGGGAVFSQNESQMVIARSVISGNQSVNGGGGIALNNNTVVSVLETEVSGNTATGNGGEGGAGIVATNDSTLNVVRSTISGNQTADTGGAISLEAASGELFVSASTLSGNTAAGQGGGIYVEDTPIVGLESTTIAANSAGAAAGGGGIFNGLDVGTGHVDLERTLLADNTAAGAASNCDVAGPGLAFVSQGFNLETTAGCGLAGAGDLQNAAAGLGPLADNGGPTQTHALLAGSDALDAAGACDDPDQRGVARPQPAGGPCDTGAFEDRGADLRVSQRDSRDPVPLGKSVVYEVTVRNGGAETATEVELRDKIPKGAKALQAKASQGSCKKKKSKRPRCSLGSLGPGEEASVQVTVRFEGPGRKVNTAKATSEVADPNPTSAKSRERTRLAP